MPWSNGLALLAAGRLAQVRGDADRALALLDQAATELAEADMELHATVARRQRGVLLGGDEGVAAVRAAPMNGRPARASAGPRGSAPCCRPTSSPITIRCVRHRAELPPSSRRASCCCWCATHVRRCRSAATCGCAPSATATITFASRSSRAAVLCVRRRTSACCPIDELASRWIRNAILVDADESRLRVIRARRDAPTWIDPRQLLARRRLHRIGRAAHGLGLGHTERHRGVRRDGHQSRMRWRVLVVD